MAPSAPHDPRLTEQRNPDTVDIDVADAARIVELLNRQDRLVPEAVWAVREPIARAIERVERAFRAGGRLIYVGAGTSGRLGVLDASECPPTFGSPPELVQGVIAGGAAAILRGAEGAEDDFDAGGEAMDAKDVAAADVVFGIAASGTTPYVRGALARAAARGAGTILLSCTDPPRDLLANVDIAILPKVGPEALTGSTRMKAGTATKLVLNTVTTGAMIRMGRAYGNLMVDLVALSDKLRDRAERIVMEVCEVGREAARRALGEAEGRVKTAIVMLRRGVDRAGAERLLEAAGGRVRGAVGEPPPPVRGAAGD
ncbi:MAG TPA: N-acetylmuramic acid 6-phosphate etherase [Gemmatimonadales bacterium]|nr:N-acetylmuramic acid 6-phosphate etherase [Gemmatimonadales bacterium]